MPWALFLAGAIEACGARTGLELPSGGPPVSGFRDGGVAPPDGGFEPHGPGDVGLQEDALARVRCDGGDVVLDVFVAPTVMLLVDQSGSMAESFGRSTRWAALRSSLVDPGGLVPRFHDTVRFGLTLYSARSENGSFGGAPIGECPLIEQVAPALRNLRATALARARRNDHDSRVRSMRRLLPGQGAATLLENEQSPDRADH